MEGFAGIDVAFAKNKRLPVVICTLNTGCLEPLPLRSASVKPPVGEGNAHILDDDVVSRFADAAAEYLRRMESEFGIRIRRVAIDAPSDPKLAATTRRQCEVGLDQRRISCITTPSVFEFEAIRRRASDHLASGGA